MSESEGERPRRMADLGSRKFEGIGPTTADGMPIILRSVSTKNVFYLLIFITMSLMCVILKIRKKFYYIDVCNKYLIYR